MYKTALALISTAAVVVACGNHPKAPDPGVTTTAGEIVANQDVVSRLTKARCDHARDCHRFGVDKDYADMAGCQSEVRHDLEGEFQPRECPHGARVERVDTCINKITNEACGVNLQDKIKKQDACRRGALCIE